MGFDNTAHLGYITNMNRAEQRLIRFGLPRAALVDKRKGARLLRVFAEDHPGTPITVAAWLKTQPASTRRGVYRGNFVLPGYVSQA
jgi:hypothetical protein